MSKYRVLYDMEERSDRSVGNMDIMRVRGIGIMKGSTIRKGVA